MAFNGSSLQHPRERLPLPAISVLDTKPEVNFPSGRFFITEIEFRVNILTFHYWKIQVFCTFVRNNFEMLIIGLLYVVIYVFMLIFYMLSYRKICLTLKECLKKFVLSFH